MRKLQDHSVQDPPGQGTAGMRCSGEIMSQMSHQAKVQDILAALKVREA